MVKDLKERTPRVHVAQNVRGRLVVRGVAVELGDALGLVGDRVRPLVPGDPFAGFVCELRTDDQAGETQATHLVWATVVLPIDGAGPHDWTRKVYAAGPRQFTFDPEGHSYVGVMVGLVAMGAAQVAYDTEHGLQDAAIYSEGRLVDRSSLVPIGPPDGPCNLPLWLDEEAAR